MSKGNIAPDIAEYFEKIRNYFFDQSTKENNLRTTQIKEIENLLNKKNSKALIIAAGLGSRLKNIPKTFLSVC